MFIGRDQNLSFLGAEEGCKDLRSAMAPNKTTFSEQRKTEHRLERFLFFLHLHSAPLFLHFHRRELAHWCNSSDSLQATNAKAATLRNLPEDIRLYDQQWYPNNVFPF